MRLGMGADSIVQVLMPIIWASICLNILFSLEGCGPRSNDTSNLSIVGGQILKAPHPAATTTVAITLNDKLLCSGAIISADLIVTAAHCFEGFPALEELKVHFHTVLPDDYTLGASVSDYEAHKFYSFPSNDIAWLRLNNPAPEGMTIATPLMDHSQLKTDVPLYIAGYGATNNKGTELGTKRLAKTIIREYRQTPEHPGMIFFGTTKGKSACYGDSGGPGFLKGPKGQWQFAGVANGPDFIIAGTDDCESGNGIYTDVATHWLWLKKAATNSPSKASALSANY